ncbi:DUF4139 domain-containing protein [Thermosulfurimonas sp. F29]|uniref:DUF4139 domain-containing protein n=1 Tax=Thermosulfurimonas sp. F29 TaxID=2867247 RepID=UPI001C83F710|nr:DUF4139 domain-containing protein [Thermosulfurimonas sp. F29]MBX6422597.1 DUF4139 domain-containing protein [Thermosulfurimonas sp. F29]
MRCFLLSLIGFVLLSSAGFSLERKPLVLTLSPEGAYLTEEIRFSAREAPRIPFPGSHRAGDLETLLAPPGCVVTWEFRGEGEPEGEIAEKRKTLRKREEALERELEVLKFEESWLRALRPGDLGKDPWGALSRISESLRRIGERRATLKGELAGIRARLTVLGESLALKRVSFFTPYVECPAPQSGYVVRVRYPLPAVEFREERLIFVTPGEDRVRVELGLRLIQRLGRKWPPLSVVYETYPRRFTILAPPPFQPWYVDAPLKKVLRATIKLPKVRETVVEPTFRGKSYHLRLAELPPGVPRFLLLEERSFPAKLRVEIPAYRLPRAFLSLSLRPDTYLPGGRTRIFLGKRELPARNIPALNPGAEVNLYLGEDPWVKVEREVLRDYKERVGVVKRRLRRTLEWRLTVKSAHPRTIPAVLYDRIPVSRREEIKIQASADPPWDERTPQGKILWRLRLSPDKLLRFTIRVIIERPVP